MASARILIVEDNPSDVFLLRRALRDQGVDFHMEVLPDGECALQFVHSQRKVQDPKPCVIVLDLHLPKHDGLEVLRAIRHEPVLSHIQIVVMTTVASPLQEMELRHWGAHFRLKPKGLAEFAELARDLIAICTGPPSLHGSGGCERPQAPA